MMPKLVPEARPSSEPQGQEPTSPPSSPTKATADPGNGTVVGTLRSPRDQDSESNANHSGASSDSDASRENVANSDRESASGDHFTYLDTDEVTIRVTWKKYRKRAQASVTKARAAYGLRLNSSRLVTAARPCGDMTMKLSEWSGIELLRKIVALLKCIRWQSELTSYSILQSLPTWKFTPGNQRPKPMARGKSWYCY